jgi:hypothetical protein
MAPVQAPPPAPNAGDGAARAAPALDRPHAGAGSAATIPGIGPAAGARRWAGEVEGGSTVSGRAGWDRDGIVKIARQDVQRPCLPARLASRR